MNPTRRRWLWLLGAAGPWPALAHAADQAPAVASDTATVAATDIVGDTVRRGRRLVFPRDHGAHLGTRTEWWYATGWLGDPMAPVLGFQVTFFRSRTGLGAGNPSRFAPRQLLFAHAAVTALAAQQHLHDERIVRWSGTGDSLSGRAATSDTDVHIGPWRLHRNAAGWQVAVPARDFSLALQLTPTQPLLLQGDAGFSRKGPQEAQASHYYSAPQLAASGRVVAAGTATSGPGRAWLDHEWSQDILHPEAVGWDWVGMNLFDGSALTVFVLRRRDGTVLWAGGSYRPGSTNGATGPASRSFAPAQVQMTAGGRWRSPATNASYPLQWQLDTPAGRHTVKALMDAQELDSRASTGTIYWEGLSELLDGQGQRVGLGYLEMTGYAAPLRL